MIKEIFPNDKHIILSASPNNEATEEKKQWVKKYVNEILNIDEEIYIDYPKTNKVSFLKDLLLERDILGSECVLIDDYHDYLRRAENELGMQVYHPSYFVAKFEKYYNNTRGMRANCNVLDEYTISQTDFDIRNGKYDSIIAKSIRN